ncbi:DUF342 domain-containing protein [Paenibacillus thermoaerophilus]|uniref:DUF342 domain-containing protein n=1 Tax=Paenibacillus thermoaerophilus TaxID=1215385 RepID=A0ABW2V2L2_9BACL|nr:FapA family protein [Paenibacillus thermoaerophilus]TMV13820.1 DUF342 domain-containing protein [Paenibacillus thermoaerophilus]
MLDQDLLISTTDDKLRAYLQFKKKQDYAKLPLNELEELLAAYQIRYGVFWDVIGKIAAEPNAYLGEKVLIAQGDPAIEGEDGKIVLLFDGDSEKRPSETEDGKVDFRELRQLNNVRKGQKIAERLPPKEGINGIDVTGQPIIAKKGKEARFKPGKNVILDPEQNNMYAALDGQVVRTEGQKINVFPVFEVNGDVDYNVGNIDFVGNVVIRGNVLNGFRVRADGDIRIIGGVEAAEVLAGGSIDISAGILGLGKGLVKAGRNVKVSFIQDGNVEAAEDVIVAQSIMHSQIRAGRSVLCDGAKGLIVGGTIQAGERVRARTIGNPMSTQTAIEVGVLPELRNEHAELRGVMRDLLDRLDKTEKALVLLDQMAAAGQLSPDKLAMRVKLNHTKKQMQEEYEEAKQRMYEIEKILENTDTARVEVLSTIYGGTRIVIGRQTRFIKDAVQRMYFRIVDGEIAMLSLT